MAGWARIHFPPVFNSFWNSRPVEEVSFFVGVFHVDLQ